MLGLKPQTRRLNVRYDSNTGAYSMQVNGREVTFSDMNGFRQAINSLDNPSRGPYKLVTEGAMPPGFSDEATTVVRRINAELGEERERFWTSA